MDLKPSILCVDDEVEALSTLKEYFMNVKEMGFETAGNPETVVGYLEAHPEVDIVLSDIVMPNINGWELLKRIKARFPLLKVILYSGYPDKLKQKPNDAPEPDHMLQKPFKLEQLTNIINTISRQRL